MLREWRPALEGGLEVAARCRLDTVPFELAFTATCSEAGIMYLGEFNAEHLCLPNPHYAESDTVPPQPRQHELALPKVDLGVHLAPRAEGATGEDERWLFTGRADLIHELIATVTDDLAGGRTSGRTGDHAGGHAGDRAGWS